MTFSSGKHMLDYILSVGDLYSPERLKYVFRYSEDGALCAYSGISLEVANKLDEEAKQTGEYWGAMLGPGGEIYDDPLEWCNNHYKGEWVNVPFYIPNF